MFYVHIFFITDMTYTAQRTVCIVLKPINRNRFVIDVFLSTNIGSCEIKFVCDLGYMMDVYY